MKPILIVVTGTPSAELTEAHGDFAAMFDAAMDADTVAVDARYGELPDPSDFAGIVVTGSSSGVHEEEPWMRRLAEWLVAQDRPTLGVCFGHQLLAWAHGGVVRPHRVECGVVEVEVLEDDPLFEGLGRSFGAFESHFDAVTVVPDNARVLARSDRAVQALAFGDRVRGVQFHPEFVAGVIRIVLDGHKERLEVLEPGHAARGRDSVRELPEMRRVLANFLKHFVRG